MIGSATCLRIKCKTSAWHLMNVSRHADHANLLIFVIFGRNSDTCLRVGLGEFPFGRRTFKKKSKIIVKHTQKYDQNIKFIFHEAIVAYFYPPSSFPQMPFIKKKKTKSMRSTRPVYAHRSSSIYPFDCRMLLCWIGEKLILFIVGLASRRGGNNQRRKRRGRKREKEFVHFHSNFVQRVAHGIYVRVCVCLMGHVAQRICHRPRCDLQNRTTSIKKKKNVLFSVSRHQACSSDRYTLIIRPALAGTDTIGSSQNSNWCRIGVICRCVHFKSLFMLDKFSVSLRPRNGSSNLFLSVDNKWECVYTSERNVESKRNNKNNNNSATLLFFFIFLSCDNGILSYHSRQF